MILSKELIYEEKPSREDFGINDEGALNNRIYNEWFLSRKELDPEDCYYYSKITKVFNDAYFFCTLVLMHPEKEINLNYFKGKISFPSLVYPLAHFYLSLLKKPKRNTKRLLTMIQNIIDKNPDIQENYDAIIKLKQDKMEIKSPDFTPRKLTPDFLSTIEWNRITKGYNPEEIKRTIHYIAKDEVEKEMMAEAILAAAKKTEGLTQCTVL